MLCLRIKVLPVKYFHTSCSQKVTKYFLSSLISSSVCMNSLATPYPFLEVHCFTSFHSAALKAVCSSLKRGDPLSQPGAQCPILRANMRLNVLKKYNQAKHPCEKHLDFKYYPIFGSLMYLPEGTDG